MDIGINVSENLRIRLGDKLDDTIERFNKENIKYTIPYRLEERNKSNLIIFLEYWGIELNAQNGYIVFIKSNNTELNFVMQITSNSPIEALNIIKEKVAEKFDTDLSAIRVDKFNLETYESMLVIPVTNILKAKIELITGLNRRLYMKSLTLTR